MTDRIIRTAEEQQITGLSRVQLWREEQAGRLPPRRALTSGGRVKGRLLSEITTWMQTRPIAIRDNTRIGRGKPGPGRGHRRQAA